MTTRLLPYFVLLLVYFVLQLAWPSYAMGFGVCYLRLCLRVKQADIRVAMCVGFPSFAFPLNQAFCSKLATEGGMRSIGC